MQRPAGPPSGKSTTDLLAAAQSSPADAADGGPPALEQSRRAVQHPPVWAQRLLLGIEVGISVWTGILVLILPWTPLWTENPLLDLLPGLKVLLNFTFVRGMISGIGIVDIGLGIADALHHRDLR